MLYTPREMAGRPRPAPSLDLGVRSCYTRRRARWVWYMSISRITLVRLTSSVPSAVLHVRACGNTALVSSSCPTRSLAHAAAPHRVSCGSSASATRTLWCLSSTSITPFTNASDLVSSCANPPPRHARAESPVIQHAPLNPSPFPLRPNDRPPPPGWPRFGCRGRRCPASHQSVPCCAGVLVTVRIDAM